MTALAIAGLSAGYGEGLAVRGVGLEARAGEVVCLLGRNGAGKTTLLKAIAGLLPAREGGIVLDGADLTLCPADERARLGIGYVPQGREIFPQLTVRENLEVALAAAGRRDGRIAIVLVEQYLDFATRLADRVYLMEKGTIVAAGRTQEVGADAIRRHLAV